MDRLTGQAHWEDSHQRGGESERLNASDAAKKGHVRRWLSAHAMSFADRVLWQQILPDVLNDKSGGTVLEVGSAPGMNLVRLHKAFHLDPFGLEYTAAGAERNRELFRREGIPPDHVIQGDFFDDAVVKPWLEKFDVVFSGGFIEHFADVRGVVERHRDMLAPDGILIIVIPNLQGLNRLLVQASWPDLLNIHNLSIMNQRAWRTLFSEIGLETRRAAYYGTLDLNVTFEGRSRLGKWFPKALELANAGSNLVLNTIFPHGEGFQTSYTSPYLIYVGQKRVRA